MALGRAFARVGVLFVSLVAMAGTGEVGLRLLGRSPDPVDFQRRNDPTGWDSDGLGRVPVSFDPQLFWRRASDGRTSPEAEHELVLLVLADGSAFDPRHGRPWPERLERLLDFNEAARPIRILDAAEPGYSSLQGRRRLERFTGRPELVVVGLGANDAHRVRISDVEYARRLERLGSLARSWLALHAAHRLWAFTAPQPTLPRIGAEETRANLDAIAARVRSWGGEVVPLENPTAALSPDPEARPPSEAIAAAVFDLLTERGLLLTRHLHPAEADMGAQDGWPALDHGFGQVEAGPLGLPGRWMEAEASLTLERRAAEAGLALELTCPTPAEAKIEANGIAIGGLGGCFGRRWYRFSLEPITDDTVQVRLVTPHARQLFVHGVWLTRSGVPADDRADPLYASELGLDEAEDRRPELGPGWWPREVWADGRRGRWTAREATLYLERRDSEGGLHLEVTLQNPGDATSCRIEINGVPVYAFISANGRHRYGVDIGSVPGRRLRVRLVAARTFVPGADDDDRSLGLFVHSVRLARSAIP